MIANPASEGCVSMDVGVAKRFPRASIGFRASKKSREPVPACLSLSGSGSHGRFAAGVVPCWALHGLDACTVSGLSGGFGHRGAGSIPLLEPISETLGTLPGLPVPRDPHWSVSPVVRRDHQRLDGDLSVLATRGRRLVRWRRRPASAPPGYEVGDEVGYEVGVDQTVSSTSIRPMDPSWARRRAVVVRSRWSPSTIDTSPRPSCTRIRAASAPRR